MIWSYSLKPLQISEPAGVKQAISSQFFSIFELEGIAKHLMTGPAENSEFCYSSGFASGNIEGLRETKLTVSLGASH